MQPNNIVLKVSTMIWQRYDIHDWNVKVTIPCSARSVEPRLNIVSSSVEAFASLITLECFSRLNQTKQKEIKNVQRDNMLFSIVDSKVTFGEQFLYNLSLIDKIMQSDNWSIFMTEWE